jgi:hypothetical protein
MSDHRVVPASMPNDAFEARVARYLDWEAAQLGGARTGDEIAASIATRPIERRWGRNPMLVWAAVVMALIVVVAAAIAMAGRGPNQLVTAPSNDPSVALSAPPLTDAPPTATPDPNCSPLEGEIPYLANVGTLPVSVPVPATSSGQWLGARDHFFLGRGSCDPASGPSPFFDGALVAHIYADSCHWKSSEIEVPTAFDAAEELAKQTGHPKATSVETHLGPFRATRLDIAIPATASIATCDDGQLRLWGDKQLVPGVPVQIYVAEIDGTTLIITANYIETETTPADLEEIDAIIASVRIEI